MKWPTFTSKINEWTAKRGQWHHWFAWRPVVMEGFQVPTSGTKLSPDNWIWWEDIERCADRNGNWKYRPVKEKNTIKDVWSK